MFKICAVEEYAFFFSFSRSTEVDFFDEDFKSTLPVLMPYFGVDYAIWFLFTATVDSFNEAVEDIFMNRETDERIVLDLIVEFDRGCVLHLILNFLRFYLQKSFWFLKPCFTFKIYELLSKKKIYYCKGKAFFLTNNYAFLAFAILFNLPVIQHELYNKFRFEYWTFHTNLY